MAAASNKAPRKKADRKTVLWVAMFGMASLIVFLFASQGSDLGQGEIDAKRAEQKKEEVAKRYEQKVESPKASSQRQLEVAQATVRRGEQEAAATAASKARAAIMADMPEAGDSKGAFPAPGGVDGLQLDRMDAAAKAITPPAGAGTAATSGEPARAGFVVFSAPPPKDAGSALGLTSPDDTSDRVASQTAITQDDINAQTDPEMKAAYERLAALQARQADVSKLMAGAAEQITRPNGEANEAWLYRNNNDRSEIDKPVTAKRVDALYWLAPGTIIHAVVQNGIDTRLPGSISARVTQTVYDSRYGRYVVIPAGSVLRGSYNSSVADGQKRVMTGFKTLVTPAGGLVDLGALPGADNLGVSGMPGKLHTHFAKRMGISLLLALEAIGMDRLEGKKTTVTPYGQGDSQSISSGAQIIVNTANEEVKRRNAVGPNITVKPGQPITLTLNSGIEIPPIANAR